MRLWELSTRHVTKNMVIMALGLILGWGLTDSFTAEATELPPTVLSYLQEKDKGVNIRFDGMVTFPNGTVYLPIFPQDPSQPENPNQVLSEEMGDAVYPDLIHFDNNLFLIRLVNTASGKLALARMEMYPIELKEGLLPQDLLLPLNLYIPTELKVILGDLHYDPKGNQNVMADTPEKIARDVFDATRRSPIKKTLYMTDIDKQTLVVVDPDQGRTKETIELNCVASRVIPSKEGHAVYVSCLTSDELVVVDTFSNLVKARISVGSKPTGVLYIEGEDQLLVSHRFSNFLTAVSTVELTASSKILLPGNGGEMLRSHWNWHVYVADYTAGKIYDLDLVSQQIVRTLPGLKNISALWLDERDQENQVMWMASRSSHQVMAINFETGEPLAVIDVGKKPVAFAPLAENGLLYVLSASDARVDVIDLKTRSLVEPAITLEPGSFPTAITVSEKDEKAYITTAGTDELFVVDLKGRTVQDILSLEVRGMGITLLGVELDKDKTDEASSELVEGVLKEEINKEENSPLSVDELPNVSEIRLDAEESRGSKESKESKKEENTANLILEAPVSEQELEEHLEKALERLEDVLEEEIQEKIKTKEVETTKEIPESKDVMPTNKEETIETPTEMTKKKDRSPKELPKKATLTQEQKAIIQKEMLKHSKKAPALKGGVIEALIKAKRVSPLSD